MSKQFVVLDKFGGPAHISLVYDENGEVKVFESFEAAQEEADECQDRQVVPLEE